MTHLTRSFAGRLEVPLAARMVIVSMAFSGVPASVKELTQF